MPNLLVDGQHEHEFVVRIGVVPRRDGETSSPGACASAAADRGVPAGGIVDGLRDRLPDPPHVRRHEATRDGSGYNCVNDGILSCSHGREQPADLDERIGGPGRGRGKDKLRIETKQDGVPQSAASRPLRRR